MSSNSPYRFQLQPYPGPIWQDGGLYPELWQHLQTDNLLLELSSGSPPYSVVLGVPHHAKVGDTQIAENWLNPKTGRAGRPADEMVGLTALAVFTALVERGLDCRLIIAVHPTDHDPNKTSDSLYFQQVFTSPLPGLLLELHGSSKERPHSLELSAGANPLARPLDFAALLFQYLNAHHTLAAQVQPGKWAAVLFRASGQTPAKLQHPALETLSLTHAGQLGIPALHLEMKPVFRRPDPACPLRPCPAAPAWRLAYALADTIQTYPGGTPT